MAKYQAAYAGNEQYYETLGIHSEQEYYDKFTEVQGQYGEYLEMIDDTEDAVVDMYESQIDAIENWADEAISAYEDYIDVVKESLQAERDLYDFKRKIEDQSSSIAETERKIMSLSGSTNAADIAERRRLQATLYDQQRDLEDSYRDHAQQSQEDALDAEAEAYTESMNNMIEGLRTSLEAATINMDEFLMGVTSMVMYNADTVLSKYEETNLPLTKELTNPWEEAKKAVGSYSGNALDLMNQWTKEGGFFAQFNATGTTNLQSPWKAGTTAATNFKADVAGVMSGVVSNISTNVKTASGALSSLYQQIQATEKSAASANVTVNSGGSGGSSGGNGGYVQKKYYTTATLNVGGYVLKTTQSATTEAAAKSAAQIELAGQFADFHERRGISEARYESSWLKTYRNQIKYNTSYYAKGTTGTERDEWAITDEFGPELKMYATPEGNLSFMALGSTVVPHDLTMDLIELPDVVDGLINMPKFDSGINMISNSINKPELNFTFDALVKAENITEETLPAVKKLVTQELNRFTKELNYALKGKGAR